MMNETDFLKLKYQRTPKISKDGIATMQTLKKKTCTAVLIEYYQSWRVAKEYKKDNVEVYHKKDNKNFIVGI